MWTSPKEFHVLLPLILFLKNHHFKKPFSCVIANGSWTNNSSSVSKKLHFKKKEMKKLFRISHDRIRCVFISLLYFNYSAITWWFFFFEGRFFSCCQWRSYLYKLKKHMEREINSKILDAAHPSKNALKLYQLKGHLIVIVQKFTSSLQVKKILLIWHCMLLSTSISLWKRLHRWHLIPLTVGLLWHKSSLIWTQTEVNNRLKADLFILWWKTNRRRSFTREKTFWLHFQFNKSRLQLQVADCSHEKSDQWISRRHVCEFLFANSDNETLKQVKKVRLWIK